MSSLGRGLESLIPPPDDNGGAPQDGAVLPTDDPASASPVVIEPAVSQSSVAAVSDIPALPTEPPPVPLPEGEHRGSFGHAHNTRKYHATDAVFQIEVEKIKPNPEQPRRTFNEDSLRELATSIREHGVLQPLVVSKIQKDTEDGSEVEYQLIAGERRLIAARMAGLERVPAIVRAMGAKREQLELAIIENLQREDLTPIETARAFARLQDEFGLTQREIATRLGKSRESVANTIRLLNLPSSIQESLEKNQINESQARLLLAVTDLASQERLFRELTKNNLSVRELKSRIKKAAPKPAGEVEKEFEYNPEVEDVKEQLQQFFGAPVEVEQTGDKGKIVISFYSDEELRNIVSRLAAGHREDDDYGAEDEFGV